MAQTAPSTNTDQLQRELEVARRDNAELRQRLGRQRRQRGRTAAAGFFLLLGLLLVLPAEILLWANRTVTDTDRYVATVAPIIHQPAVQKAITKSATDALFNSVDIQAYVTQALPDQAKPLAAPLASQVKGYIVSAAGRVVASDRFAATWVNVNRSAQEQFINIAKNSNGNPTINVDQLYSAISQNFAGTPLAPLAGKELPPKVGQITVVTIPALQRIPHFVTTLGNLRWLLLGLSLGLLILALAVSTDRRRMAVYIGIGWMAVVVLGFLGVRLARAVLLAQIPDPTYNAAAADVWRALLQPLLVQSVVLFLAGAVLAAVGWLLGPSRVAVRWRTALERGLGAARARLLPAADATSWNHFLRRNHSATLWVLLILTIAALLWFAPLTVASLSLVLLAAAVIWLVLEFLTAPSPG